jgi:TPP-dependent pyruvate/acetoin dehydrogenase alpha subunit
LLRAGVAEASLSQIAEQNRLSVEEAVAAAEAAPSPDPAGMENEVYAPREAADWILPPLRAPGVAES